MAASVTIVADVPASASPSTIVNTATITASDETDTNAANDSDTASITVQGIDLAVTKTVDDTTPNEGSTVVYTVVLNLFVEFADNVVIDSRRIEAPRRFVDVADIPGTENWPVGVNPPKEVLAALGE